MWGQAHHSARGWCDRVDHCAEDPAEGRVSSDSSGTGFPDRSQDCDLRQSFRSACDPILSFLSVLIVHLTFLRELIMSVLLEMMSLREVSQDCRITRTIKLDMVCRHRYRNVQNNVGSFFSRGRRTRLLQTIETKRIPSRANEPRYLKPHAKREPSTPSTELQAQQLNMYISSTQNFPKTSWSLVRSQGSHTTP